MKKLFLTAVVLTFVGTVPMAVADGPIDGKVYGKVNVSVVNTDTNSGDAWELNSNASRIGFKGATEISDSLEVFYQAEFEIALDDGVFKNKTKGEDTDTVTFKQRNIMVGLRGNFGSVFAGKHDSPTKMAGKPVDLFNDLEGDIKNAFEGENRLSNIVAYSTPKVNGFKATLAMIPAENNDVDGDGNKDTGLADGISYSVTYQANDLYVAVAGDQDVDGQDLLRIVSQYKINALKLGAMYQQNEKNDGSLDESGYFFSAAYKVDQITYKAQFGSIEDDMDGDEEETLSLGADYKLAKNTKAFVFYTDNSDSSVDGSQSDETTFGIGLEHKF
jgi:predicted porin